MPKVVDYSRSGVILYSGNGRKCQYCNCRFFSNIDYEHHIRTHWRKAKHSDGEWLPAELDPHLTHQLRIVGKLVMGGYRYTLLPDGKVIYRIKLDGNYL